MLILEVAFRSAAARAAACLMALAVALPAGASAMQTAAQPASRPATAADVPVPKGAITPEELRDLIEKLASDEFEGRGSGEPGGRKAGDFAADQMHARGIEPFGVNGTYFQPFEDKGVNMRNVIGVVHGKDKPKKGEEFIIISAHYDHCGLGLPGAGAAGNRGEVHHGADDNASGTAAVLAIGRAVAQAPLGRSVICMLFDGEERGLLGSQYYATHPLVPLENVYGVLNIDMIGRSYDGYLFIGGIGTSPVWDGFITKALKPEARWLKNVERCNDDEGRSDQHNFVVKEIPALFFFTGVHRDYHQPRDTSDKIQYKPAAAVVRAALDIAKSLSAVKSKPEFHKVGENGMPKGDAAVEAAIFRRAAALARRLGGALAASADGTPYFADTEGAGAKAGIRKNDRILAIRKGADTGAWKEVKTVEKLRVEVEKLSPGDTIQLKLRRDDKDLTITTTIGDVPEWKNGPAKDGGDLPPGPVAKGQAQGESK